MANHCLRLSTGNSGTASPHVKGQRLATLSFVPYPLVALNCFGPTHLSRHLFEASVDGTEASKCGGMGEAVAVSPNGVRNQRQ